MQVIIDELVSTVRAVEGESVLGPETLRQVVEAVRKVIQAERDHDQRAEEERCVSDGPLSRERGR
jgi:hypothetical protein